jgi:hypothetical protein
MSTNVKKEKVLIIKSHLGVLTKGSELLVSEKALGCSYYIFTFFWSFFHFTSQK